MNESLIIKEESPNQVAIQGFLHQGDEMHRNYRAYVGRTVEELSKSPYRFVVAYWQSQTVGCGALNTATGEIERVFVDKQFRQKKIGSHILTYLEAAAQEHALLFVILDVAEGNTDALGMYKNKGYRPVETRHGFVTMKKMFLRRFTF